MQSMWQLLDWDEKRSEFSQQIDQGQMQCQATHLVVTTGKQPTNAGKKIIAVWGQVTGKGPFHPNTTVEVTMSYVSRHYSIYLRTRDMVTLHSGCSQQQNARC